MTDYYKNKLAFITGGANGIGKSLAGQLAAAGSKVIVTDVDVKGAEDVAGEIRSKGGQAASYPLDVTDRDAVMALAEEVHESHGVVDFLFNNAGIGMSGDFLSIPAEAWKKIFDINVMGIVNCSQAFVPAMIKRSKGGHVINTASASGYAPTYFMAPYVATKFAAMGISGAQRLEWENFGIRVTAVCPGIINTNVVKNMLVYGVMAKKGVKEKVQKLYVNRGYSADKVAQVVLNKLPKTPYILPVSIEAWASWLMMRLKPSSTYLQKLFNKQPGKKKKTANRTNSHQGQPQ